MTTVELVEKTAHEIAATEHAHREEYIAERVAAGEQPEQARAIAERQHEQYFPGGEPAEGHRHYWVVSDGRRVGTLWLGPASGDVEAMDWVYLVEIDEAQRSKGLGRAAMLAAEAECAARGSSELGLNVFGPNTVARGLYTSLGFEEVAVNMRKRLSPQ